MMESSNLDHLQLHQLQDQLHGSSSSSCPLPSPPPFHFHDQPWSQNLTSMNNNGGHILIPSANDTMVQELGLFHYHGNGDDHHNYIKEEFSDTSTIEDHSFHPPLSRGPPLFDIASLGNSGMVLNLPMANAACLPPPFPISLSMDLQALDILASAKFGRSFSSQQQHSINSMALFRDEGHLPQQPLPASNIHHPMEKKRPTHHILEQTASQAVSKKSRVESPSSFSPIKVRKEKLGDRIAALQQLVAPFGKTDTASVLMEAIGYIKFLQDQIETLSVPYMRSSNNNKLRSIQRMAGEERDEPKPDLRSRGLCLVPLQCTSYVSNEDGGFWSPPNFGGT